MSTNRSPSPALSTVTSHSRCTRKRMICCGCPKLTSKQWMSVCGSVLVPMVLALAATGLSIQQQYIANKSDARKEALAASVQMDAILADFIKQMVTILKLKDGEDRPSDQTIDYYIKIITPMIVITAHQIDLRRKALLFSFLRQCRLLVITQKQYVSLDKVNFDNIDLSFNYDSHRGDSHFSGITFAGGSFISASFNDRRFDNVNMNFINVNGAAFRRCSLYKVSFREGLLQNTDFTGAELSNIDFSDVDLRGSKIAPEQLFKKSNKLTGAALPNGSIVPVPNLLGMKHYGEQLPHNEQCTSGLILLYYTEEIGEVVNVLIANGQDCFFAAKLAFVESIVQKTMEVTRYSTWFSTGRIRYCLRATIGPIETDSKVGQSVKIVGRAMDENKKILHSAQLGPFTQIKTEKHCWPVPTGTMSFTVELIFRNELAVNITDKENVLLRSQTFGLIKDVFLTTEY